MICRLRYSGPERREENELGRERGRTVVYVAWKYDIIPGYRESI